MIRTISQGTGPPVLWIHGYTMDSTIWEDLWELLPGWRHIGLDLPGHGRSDPMPPALSLAELASSIADVARTEGARGVVALSFGSLAAVQLVLDHPDLVDTLVLAAPTLAGAPSDPAARRRYQELLMLNAMVGVGDAIVDRWMTSPPNIFLGTERHPELRARLRAVCRRHSWAELSSGAMQHLTDHRHDPEDLARITADTLVIVGDEDMPTFVGNAQTLCRSVARCRTLTVEHAGHLPLLERPAVVAPHLDRHLRSTGFTSGAQVSGQPHGAS